MRGEPLGRKTPVPPRSIAAAAIAAALVWNAGVTITVVAAASLLLLIAVARATRERLHGTTFAAAALVVALISTLLVPMTWGVSLLLAAIGVPLALPSLRSHGRSRWLATFAFLLNAALVALFALIWVV
jgi:hypothetical protein